MAKQRAFGGRHGFLWVTGLMFVFALAGHWLLAWQAYKREARDHGQTPEPSGFVVEAGRDTLENWQSEFLQLVWQVGGLSFLLSVGSTQSKESTERMEAKLDYLMNTTPEGRAARERLDAEYMKGTG